ncbi:hypothetical protein R3P38DRAFT_2815277 [Favolaschia claudopus]|uniref:Uncharacterized protein n=1 Tax=Favolaschia claudopus TaxID=2862362 RepID=A0AAV9Z1W0_9AGAR
MGAPQVKQGNTTEAAAEATKGVAEAVKIRRGGMGFWEAKKTAKACAKPPEIPEFDLIPPRLVQQCLYLQHMEHELSMQSGQFWAINGWGTVLKTRTCQENAEKTAQIARRRPTRRRAEVGGRHAAFPVWEDADQIAICVKPSPEARSLRGVLLYDLTLLRGALPKQNVVPTNAEGASPGAEELGVESATLDAAILHRSLRN